jgi:dihydroorotase
MIHIRNATLINEGTRHRADVYIDGERIHSIREATPPAPAPPGTQVIDATGLLLLPGLIDDQVHFREPGLTHKGNLHTESRAAVAGGITSYIDMPNTLPPTTTLDALNDKLERASRSSLANYAFAIGATNDNLAELQQAIGRAIAVKVFLGSSTGNLLVDNPTSLKRIFSELKTILLAHCESETLIRANRAQYIQAFGTDLDTTFHPLIRSAEACYASSSEAVALARKYNTRLHLFHLSTAREMDLLESKPLKDKRITAEVCIHHLWFSDEDYAPLGSRIQWNPAIKTPADRDALRQALIDGKIDVIATDHAPHTWSEKQGSCLQAASGAPMVQHALVVLLELCRQGIFTPELIVEKMAHAPATLFGLKDRGYLRPGYYADFVLVDPHRPWTVTKDNLLYACGWSPLEGVTFSHQVRTTFVNGHPVYDHYGRLNETWKGKELCFKS